MLGKQFVGMMPFMLIIAAVLSGITAAWRCGGLTAFDQFSMPFDPFPHAFPPVFHAFLLILHGFPWFPARFLSFSTSFPAVHMRLDREEDWTDFAVITLMLLVNALIGFHEEFKARQSLDALKAQMTATVPVKRDGHAERFSMRCSYIFMGFHGFSIGFHGF